MRFLFLIGLCWMGPRLLFAQADPLRVQRREIPLKQWQKAAAGLDYSKDVPKDEAPKPSKSPEMPSNWGEQLQFLGSLFQILAIIAAIALIAWGIYRMVRQPRNRRIARDGAEITLDNLDAYIHETDLERFLRDALSQKNYPLAIRLYFLQIIKDLSQAGHINWSKEKTNRDYLREMRNHPLAQPFRQTTNTFERVWYGNAALTEADFIRLEPEFKNLLSQIMTSL